MPKCMICYLNYYVVSRKDENMSKEILKKMTYEGYESLTIEDLLHIVETTGIRFDINDGKVKRMRYERK